MVEFFGCVLSYFSLGTNPRGVKVSYTLVTIVMRLRLFSFLRNIVVAIVLLLRMHALASMYNSI